MSAPALALVPRRMSLWEHVADVENIADLVDALDSKGELTPELTEQLQQNLIRAIAGTKAKVDRTAAVLERYESTEASALREADRLMKRAARLKRQREYLEKCVLAVFEASPNLENRLEGDTSTLKRQKNPPSVVIDNEGLLPEEFLRFPDPAPPPPATPDKSAIKAAIKAGFTVHGARLATTFRLVRE